MTTPPAFHAARANGVTRLVGELDMSTVPILRAALASAPHDEPATLDLSELTFIDSSGLHELSRRAAEGTLILVDASDHVAMVLGLVGLNHAKSIEIR